MLQYILFDTTLFSPGDSLEETRKDLMWILESLSQRNMGYLKQNPKTPSLYKSGVKYTVPAQFDGECAEVQTIRNALTKSAANQADVARVLDTMQSVFGGERFRDIGRIIENGGGDCFAKGTKMLRRDGQKIAVEDLKAGDEIWGRHRWSRVEATANKGVLPVFDFYLDNGKSFTVTGDHKLFVVARTGAVVRVHASEIANIGDHIQATSIELIAPKHVGEVRSDPRLCNQTFANFNDYFDSVRRVHNVVWGDFTGDKTMSRTDEVFDIQTDDHYVYLVDADVTVSNCDNVACWRVAELRQAGIPARPYMTNRTRPDGGTTYHALVLWPPIPGVPYETSEDPSLLLGMGGPSRKPDRDLEIQKNQERCDILRNKPGSIASLTPPSGDLAAAIDDVLGLRKASGGGLNAAAAEIGDLLKRMG